MSLEYNKIYDPGKVEDKWYSIWQNNNIYISDNKSEKKSFSILMPPPNVTGILHFGHVLNITIQDLYIRWKRMQGYEVCWFPGTDHAGIATQTKVESELKKENLSRYDLGRDKFIERVWDWKEKYGGIILSQLRKLGISADWSRTLFTMDESASNAVREVFIRLFDEGLIYKGKRIINWSPLAQTALSDEEVEFREVKEHLFTLRYYFEDEKNYLSVATVRPETIFGDVAVAVNPEDERFIHLLGKKVRVPLTDKWIEIIADDYADPAFGTGCVKITPAHDPNDFEVGRRHNLEMPNTINPDGTLNDLTGEFNGLDRFIARKKILEKLKECDLIEKIEDYTHNVGFSQRGGEAVEPYLSNQWFVNMQHFAKDALDVVSEGQIKFYPNHWVKTYEHWMTNVRDWCISRQLWWGHRIPVFYTPDGNFTAARDEAHARQKLNIGNDIILNQDNDVLDTWFSSWLWPLTTMKWLDDSFTESNEDLNKFLPTDLLVTAPDIIFFWVARMIIASKYFKNEIPFKNVYFTSTIRDGKGRKLSKSLGNSPDPLNIIDKYGSDAVRFTMLYLSPLGQDVKMDVDVDHQDIPSMEIGRNFANKLWNAGRFLIMKKESIENSLENNTSLKIDEFTNADKWILSKYHSTIEKMTQALDNFKVNDYSKIMYDFIWRDFCDWYVEIVKVQINDAENNEFKIKHINFAINIFEGILKLLHPIMPFVTEEIWHIINNFDENKSISMADSPELSTVLINSSIEEKFEMLQLLVEEVRRLRASKLVLPSQKLPLSIITNDPEYISFLFSQKSMIGILSRSSSVEILENIEKTPNSIGSVIRNIEIVIDLGSTIDLEKESERLQKEIERLEKNIAGSNIKLSNDKFVNNAPADIVDYERKKLSDMVSSLEKTKENLSNLNKS